MKYILSLLLFWVNAASKNFSQLVPHLPELLIVTLGVSFCPDYEAETQHEQNEARHGTADD